MQPITFFPYKPRKGQRALINFVQKDLGSGKAILIDAPNGFGKTPCLLAALLPFVLDYNKRIIWAVRTGPEVDRPIEELKKIVEKKKLDVFGLSYRGKRDMCLLLRDKKIEGVTHADANFLCSKLRDKCKYYNFDPSWLEPLLRKPIVYSDIYNFCERKKICPYFAQRHLLPFAQVVSLSYNYVLNEGMAWAIKSKIPFNDSILIIDEAHNLEKACQSLNSDKITLKSTERALEELKKYELNSKAKNLIISLKKELEKNLLQLKNSGQEESIFNTKKFIKKFKNLDELLEKIKNCGNEVRRKKLEKGLRPSSSLYHLAKFWLENLEVLDVEGIVFLISRLSKDNLQLERWDMRSAVMLEDRWKEFSTCIFCSGTLKPFDAFAEVAGISNFAARSFSPPYSEENVSFLIAKGITTKGEVLNKPMAKSYLNLIKIFIKNLETNLAIFSASYRVQESLLKAGLREVVENAGRKFFVEYEGMSGVLARKVLEEFKDCATQRTKGVLVATSTGRFAEGADFPGPELEGIFLVGIPFDRLTLRTRIYLRYYRSLYGRRGRRYAYIIPALRRASQSFGRALRNPEDKALLIAGDERYVKSSYLRLLPSWLTAWPIAVEEKNFGKAIKTHFPKNIKHL
ncbi:MAG: ATP-dependent DNA helicase [Candidatus Aenigmarchaeota archaeon]|nr:ATP-dependent DNA helicase [Candidatus Aenigmarchaeota archaeon]